MYTIHGVYMDFSGRQHRLHGLYVEFSGSLCSLCIVHGVQWESMYTCVGV
jgi:hypothetical protein